MHIIEISFRFASALDQDVQPGVGAAEEDQPGEQTDEEHHGASKTQRPPKVQIAEHHDRQGKQDARQAMDEADPLDQAGVGAGCPADQAGDRQEQEAAPEQAADLAFASNQSFRILHDSSPVEALSPWSASMR